jgi:hypothetical protein
MDFVSSTRGDDFRDGRMQQHCEYTKSSGASCDAGRHRFSAPAAGIGSCQRH